MVGAGEREDVKEAKKDQLGRSRTATVEKGERKYSHSHVILRLDEPSVHSVSNLKRDTSGGRRDDGNSLVDRLGDLRGRGGRKRNDRVNNELKGSATRDASFERFELTLTSKPSFVES